MNATILLILEGCGVEAPRIDIAVRGGKGYRHYEVTVDGGLTPQQVCALAEQYTVKWKDSVTWFCYPKPP